MLGEQQLREANALAVKWHGNESGVDYETFRTWALVLLKRVLAFDGAIWGLLAQPAAKHEGVVGACLHGIGVPALEHLFSARRSEFSSGLHTDEVSNVCVDDAAWQGPQHAQFQHHARQHGLMTTLLARFVESESSGQQFLMLSRKNAGRRFSPDETALFRLLAPHMMQSFATRRRHFIDQPRRQHARDGTAAVAVVDSAGHVHEQHPRFRAMLRREWSSWRGDRVPVPLQELAARYAGSNWRFLGEQIAAEFIAADDLYVVSARPRHPADDLTERELAVARRYAAGGSFREVAESLSVAPATVRSHLRNVFAKLQIRNKAQLADLLR